jgi:hypothetical protein
MYVQWLRVANNTLQGEIQGPALAQTPVHSVTKEEWHPGLLLC